MAPAIVAIDEGVGLGLLLTAFSLGVRPARTDATGSYRLTGLPAGTFTPKIRARGLHRSPRDDLYYRLLTMPWTQLLATFAVTYLGMNLGFGAAYYLGDAPIANADPGSFSDAFFFSKRDRF